MPTKRQRATRNLARGCDPDHWRMMLDMEAENPFAALDGVPREVWDQHRDAVLAEWTRLHPGTRPSHWWHYEAPEPRQRLGGTGSTMAEVFPAMKSGLHCGCPSGWIDRQWAFECGDRKLVQAAIDPSDPPRFESQPAYLARLNLFFEGERARVPKSDFEPVAVA